MSIGEQKIYNFKIIMRKQMTNRQKNATIQLDIETFYNLYRQKEFDK